MLISSAVLTSHPTLPPHAYSEWETIRLRKLPAYYHLPKSSSKSRKKQWTPGRSTHPNPRFSLQGPSRRYPSSTHLNDVHATLPQRHLVLVTLRQRCMDLTRCVSKVHFIMRQKFQLDRGAALCFKWGVYPLHESKELKKNNRLDP